MDILKKSLLVGFVFLISMLASPNIFAQDKTDGENQKVEATTGATVQNADSVATTTCPEKVENQTEPAEETIAEPVEETDDSAWGKIVKFCKTSGIAGLGENWKAIIMLLISCLLIYLAIAKQYEPLLLLPIAFGMLLAWRRNVPQRTLVEFPR